MPLTTAAGEQHEVDVSTRTVRSDRPRVLAAALAVVALAIAACSSGPSRADAHEVLVESGFTPETADCVLDELEEEGYSTSDLTGTLSAEVEGAIRTATEGCITADDIDNVVSEDDAREAFVRILGGTDRFTEAQADCAFDALVEAGISPSDLAAGTGFEDELATALTACT